MKTLNVNGKRLEVDADDTTPLLWALREHLGLTGTKYGCGIAQCGSCTVHLDGVAVRSCVMPIVAVSETTQITTIEGLSDDGSHPVQQAWAELDVPQCGYCQPGMIMAVAGMLNATPDAGDPEIDSQITNICRCGTFQRVRDGVHLAKEITRKSKGELA
jgi:isoquinoline 1-oxidoreductase alpha subunit